jgi:hypothetical protein
MRGLHSLQAELRDALLDGYSVADLYVEDHLVPEVGLDVHRHNIFSSLHEVLKDSFPVVCRLVDKRFFGYAAHEFVRAHPPTAPCLHEYGEHFADFLAEFPPCRGLVYLPDVARLEWLIHRAAYAAEAPTLAPEALRGLQASDASSLTFEFHPAVAYIDSPWPIDRIWLANRPGSDAAETIDLAQGGANLEVMRIGRDVMFRWLDAANFTFRHELWRGECLGQAAERALACDGSWNFEVAVKGLFQDRLLADFAVARLAEQAP